VHLTSYLLTRILFSGVLALACVITWSIVSGHHKARTELEQTASSVERILRLQLIGFTQIDGLERGFPYWYPVTEVARPEGSCVRLWDATGPLLRSSCRGRAAHRLLAPGWFARGFEFVFEPGQPIRKRIKGPARETVLEIIPDSDVEIVAAWAEVKALALPAALLIGVLCLTVWWAVRRALTPASAIMRGLVDIERGALDMRLGPYPWIEFDRIARACNTLATSLAASNRARNLLSRRLLTVQEEERQALARELHDEFGQHLTAVGANAAALRIAAQDRATREDARRIEQSAAHLLRLVRDLLHVLRPWTAEASELPESLRALAGQRTTGTGRRPRVSFDLPTRLDDLTPVIAGAVYRIVQEGLTNALRHGDPSMITVTVERDALGLTVAVDDNGDGCEQSALKDGFGIAGIRERVAALDGRVEFTANRGGGLTLVAHLPYPQGELESA